MPNLLFDLYSRHMEPFLVILCQSTIKGKKFSTNYLTSQPSQSRTFGHIFLYISDILSNWVQRKIPQRERKIPLIGIHPELKKRGKVCAMYTDEYVANTFIINDDTTKYNKHLDTEKIHTISWYCYKSFISPFLTTFIYIFFSQYRMQKTTFPIFPQC